MFTKRKKRFLDTFCRIREGGTFFSKFRGGANQETKKHSEQGNVIGEQLFRQPVFHRKTIRKFKVKLYYKTKDRKLSWYHGKLQSLPRTQMEEMLVRETPGVGDKELRRCQ